MKYIKKLIVIISLLYYSLGWLHAQGIESVIFSAAASDNNNFQPVVGTPYGASFSGANGSLEISAAYGEATYKQSTLSTENLDMNASILIYPNPTDYFVNIDLSKLPAENYKMELFDISSKLILQKNSTQSIERIDMSTFPGGTYILSVKGKSSLANFKIVKRQ
jgi:hypothetical protein